jgi:hypothetical protein
LLGHSAPVMRASRLRLMPSSPIRPVHRVLHWRRRRPHQRHQPPPHLWHGQRDEFDVQTQGPPFWPSLPTAWARVTVKKACATNAQVMCRYQPVHVRTSSWSSPTSPFAVSRLSSTAQRVPATSTLFVSGVSCGAYTKDYAISLGSLMLRRASHHCSHPARRAGAIRPQAPSYSRGPVAPAPALRRCQLSPRWRATSSASVSSCRPSASALHTAVVLETASTSALGHSSTYSRSLGAFP